MVVINKLLPSNLFTRISPINNIPFNCEFRVIQTFNFQAQYCLLGLLQSSEDGIKNPFTVQSGKVLAKLGSTIFTISSKIEWRNCDQNIFSLMLLLQHLRRGLKSTNKFLSTKLTYLALAKTNKNFFTTKVERWYHLVARSR
jgi:hypothetical protein